MGHASSFSRSSLVVTAAVLAALGCLLLPVLLRNQSSARQTLCLDHMRELSKVMMVHLDAKQCFPLASTQTIDHKPGSTAQESAAGLSWLSQLTPYMEKRSKFGETLIQSSHDKSPFNTDLIVTANQQSIQPATFQISEFVCPSFAGTPQVAASDSDYRPLNDGNLPAISNYYALAGTHFFNITGLGRLAPLENIAKHAFTFEGNGAMPFPGYTHTPISFVAIAASKGAIPPSKYFQEKPTDHGLPIKSFHDGTALTFAFTESIEPTYAAWIDGQVMWLVASWPGNPQLPKRQSSPVSHDDVGWDAKVEQNNRVAVGLRNSSGTPLTYLEPDRWSGSKTRRWAASSNHSGVVNHAYVDGHVEPISIDIDPNIYVRRVTRDGQNSVPKHPE